MSKIFNKICKKENSDIIFAILIPLVFFLLIFLMFQIYPIGNMVLAPFDARHQYVPFLEEFRYKLLHGEGLFFTSRMAGTDFYLCWLYYLTSPINLIALFFSDIILGFEVIIIIKICLISLSMALYLRKCFGKNGIYTAIFACAYSMSAYVMSYYFCTMWMDTLIIFPWLIYSFEMMLRNKKPWLYSLLLAFTIYSNFFMAMHVCIFLCFYFLSQWLENYYMGNKTSILNFIKYSLIGGFMAAPFFLPFVQLLNDKHDDATGMFLTSFADVFSSFSTIAEKQTSMDYTSNANLFCGVITLILFVAYLLDKRMNIAAKFKRAYMVLFLFICTNLGPLDYFINGFYQPNGYMGRYTYIIIFFIVCGAFEEFLSIRKSRNNKNIASLIVASLFVISFTYLFFTGDLKDSHIVSLTVGIVICVLFIFIISTWFFDNRKKTLIGILLVELLFTGMYHLEAFDYTSILNTLNNVKEIQIDTDARSEILPRDIHSETIMLNMSSLSLFSSTIERQSTKFPYMIGLRTGSNYFSPNGSAGIPSLLYNIKYVYGSYKQYFGFEKINESGNINLFKNLYETSYAYAVPKRMLELNWDIHNPFTVMNRFVGTFLGEHSENSYIYSFPERDEILVSSDYKRTDVSLNADNIFNINFEKEDGTYIEVSTIARNENICVNLKHGRFNKCVIYVNNNIYMSDTKIDGDVIYIDGVEEGDKVSVYVSSKLDTGNIKINFAYYDVEKYNTFAEAFTDKKIDVIIDDNKITGEYDIKDDEVIMISMPIIDGWSIKENGEIIEPEDFPLIIFNPNKKSGSFSMKYTTPLFKESVIISITCIIILILITVVSNHHLKKIEKEKQILQADG